MRVAAPVPGGAVTGPSAVLYILASYGPQRWKDTIRIARDELGVSEAAVKSAFGNLNLKYLHGHIRHSSPGPGYELTKKGWECILHGLSN